MSSQKPRENAVERAAPDILGTLSYKAFDSLAHFICSLVGKCDRKNG